MINYNKNEKADKILFISKLAIITTENTLNDYSKVSKHKSMCFSKWKC